MTIWGDGKARHDFLYVKDTARAVVDIMKHVSGPVNIGSGQIYSIADVVNILADITGMHDSIDWDNTKPNGQDYRAYDLSKLSEIGFQPKYSMEQGLQQTWDWYNQQQNR